MKTLNVLWQLPQYLISLVVLGWFKMTGKVVGKRYVTGGLAKYSSVYFIKSDQKSAFSMGELIFILNGYKDVFALNKAIRHEYGHAIQSVKWGWLYLLVIGIPSLLITGVAPGVAKRCYFETNAEKLAKDIELIII